jgi:hypothetical protein
MKKMLLGLTVLALVALTAPAPAAARVFLGVPGFGLFAGPPVVAPPYYGPPAYYGPPPYYYGAPYGYYGRPYAYYGRPYYRPYRGFYRGPYGGWHRRGRW